MLVKHLQILANFFSGNRKDRYKLYSHVGNGNQWNLAWLEIRSLIIIEGDKNSGQPGESPPLLSSMGMIP